VFFKLNRRRISFREFLFAALGIASNQLTRFSRRRKRTSTLKYWHLFTVLANDIDIRPAQRRNGASSSSRRWAAAVLRSVCPSICKSQTLFFADKPTAGGRDAVNEKRRGRKGLEWKH
jgi:hypothetical protein